MPSKHTPAFLCLLWGVALPALAHAQTMQGSNAAQPAAGQAPVQATAQAAPLKQTVETDPDLPTMRVGNLFTPPNGQPRSYWDGLVGHVSIEGGISGNPWTHTGRNFGQYYMDRANTATLNQIMGSLSHPITPIGGGYGVGFVIEAMYGSDARYDPTIGMGDGSLTGQYQWAPTQIHLDAHLPWIFKHGIDVQIGQMYGLMGTEGTPALARQMYSFSYAADYIMPFEMVGIVATMHLSKHMDWILGIDAGSSVTFGEAGNNSRPKGYFGFAWNNLLDGRLNIHAVGHFGPGGNNGPTRISALGWSSAGIGPKANHLMQYNPDVMVTYHASKTVSVTLDATYLHDDATRDDAYGISTYLAWDINPSLTLNARGEIFRDNNGAVISQYTGSMAYVNALRNQPYSYYNAPPTTYGDLTLGATYRPEAINRHLGKGTFTLRPEIRLDKSLNGTRPFNHAGTVDAPTITNGDENMLTFNCDAVLSF